MDGGRKGFLTALCTCISSLPPSLPLSLLQHIKAIVTHKSLVLLDSDHTAIATFLPELKVRTCTST